METGIILTVLSLILGAYWAFAQRSQKAQDLRRERQEARERAQDLTVKLLAQSVGKWLEEVTDHQGSIQVTEDFRIITTESRGEAVPEIAARLREDAATHAKLFAAYTNVHVTCEEVIRLDRVLRNGAVWQAGIALLAGIVFAVLAVVQVPVATTVLRFCVGGELGLAILAILVIVPRRDKLADAFQDECTRMREYEL